MPAIRDAAQTGVRAGPGRFRSWPTTRSGRWSARLAAVFVALFAFNCVVVMPVVQWMGDAQWAPPGVSLVLMPAWGIGLMLCGLAAGVVGLIAILRHRERSWAVWLALLPAAFALFFVLGELLFPH